MPALVSNWEGAFLHFPLNQYTGRPGLDRDEHAYRLAMAQWAVELREAEKGLTWKEAAQMNQYNLARRFSA